MVAVKQLVTADFHRDSFRYACVHEVSDGGPTKVVNDQPFIFIPRIGYSLSFPAVHVR